MVDLSNNRGFKIATAILIGGLLIAVLLPTAIGSFYEPQSSTITQAEGESYTFKIVNSTLDTVDDTNNDVTFTVADRFGNDSTTTTISEGSTNTVTFDSDSVDITVESINSTTTANVTYSASKTTGMSGITESLFGLIPLFLILMAVMYVVKLN